MSDMAEVPKKHPGAAFRVYDGQATIVLPELASVHVLNPLGTAVWNLIDGARSVDQIVEAVAVDYEVAPEQARRDVLEFVAALRQNGMVS